MIPIERLPDPEPDSLDSNTESPKMEAMGAYHLLYEMFFLLKKIEQQADLEGCDYSELFLSKINSAMDLIEECADIAKEYGQKQTLPTETTSLTAMLTASGILDDEESTDAEH